MGKAPISEHLNILFILILTTTLSSWFIPVLKGQITYPGKFNPHGSKECKYCHAEGKKQSRDTFIPGSCEKCHNPDTIDKYLHPLRVLSLNNERVTLPPDFKVSQEKILDCITCHKITCKIDPGNHNFLRGGPYESELDFCFVCHNREYYKRINPHKQLHVDGTVDSSVCLNCHVKLPKPDDHPIISHKMHLEMSATCNKCHALHQHEQEHYGRDITRSKRASMKRFKKTEEQYGIIIPLKDGHIVQCNTCHYTHQRGMLKNPQAFYENNGENKYFLRIPKAKLCYACHPI